MCLCEQRPGPARAAVGGGAECPFVGMARCSQFGFVVRAYALVPAVVMVTHPSPSRGLGDFTKSQEIISTIESSLNISIFVEKGTMEFRIVRRGKKKKKGSGIIGCELCRVPGE